MNATYRGRVRTGCLACRASKVKCDEQDPICKRCIRQHKACIYTKKRISLHPSSLSASKDGGATYWGSPFDVGPTPEPSSMEAHVHQNVLQRALSSLSSRDSSPPGQQQGENMTAGSTPSRSGQSPSLLSTLISQDIYLCTTIDLLAAKEGRLSFTYFHQEVNSPFITPYDPVNWTAFKDQVLDVVSHSTPVAAATGAVQSLYKARKNCLPHVSALSSYSAACEIFDSVLSAQDANEHFDLLLTTAFLLSLVEMLLPEETSPGPFSPSHGAFIQQLEMWSSNENVQSPLSLRLGSWLLISHAAARRSGNRGLLSATVYDLLESTSNRCIPISPINASRRAPPGSSLLSTLTEPLLTFYLRLQLLSARVADLSHYHRSRTTGADQEEVSILMSALKSRIEALWQSRPTLMRYLPSELHAQFTSLAIAEPLILLVTLCSLTYHTELVEMGRNLSAEQVPSTEAKTHLAHMRDIMASLDSWTASSDKTFCTHPAFLRHLFLYAIESTHESDTRWAVSQMREIKDPICYSGFFANFAEELAEMQRRKERRVTTKWWCLKAFNVNPPFL